MGVFKRMMNYLGLQEEEEYVERQDQANHHQFEEEAEPNVFESKVKNKNNVVSIHSQKNTRVMLFEPRTFEDAQELADHLRSRRAIIINMQRLRSDIMIRIVDFLSGTVYALNGSISKLGPCIYICTPDSMEIHGSISDYIQEN